MPAHADWIDKYLEWTFNTESPTSFHTASAMSAIASVVERRVWLDTGVGQMFPNMFFILVGPPASRKSTAALFAKELIEEVPGIQLAPDNITKEAMYQEMEANAIKIHKHRSGKYIHTSYTAIATEWSMFLGEKDNKFLMALIKLFDCEKSFQYKTKTAGSNFLPNVYFNMLGCIQPHMIPETLPHAAIGSGFTSRLVMVVEHGRRKTVTRPSRSAALRKELIEGLIHISGSYGEFHLDSEAQEFLDEWYESHDKGTLLALDDRFASYIHRKPVHAQKIALINCLSRARGTEHRVRLCDMRRAVEWLEGIESNMPEAYGAFGMSKEAHIANTILSSVRQNGRVTSDEILSVHFRDMNLTEMESAMRTLVAAGLIKTKELSHGRWELRTNKE